VGSVLCFPHLHGLFSGTLPGSIVERTVWTLAVILLSPTRQDASYIIECAEPVCVHAFVAQSSVEALDMAILHRPPWLDVHQPNLRVLGPAQHTSRGELGAVIRAQIFWPTTLLDQPLQHTCYAPASEAGVDLKRQALTRVRTKLTQVSKDIEAWESLSVNTVYAVIGS
jgi:hypothetical protein